MHLGCISGLHQWDAPRASGTRQWDGQWDASVAASAGGGDHAFGLLLAF